MITSEIHEYLAEIGKKGGSTKTRKKRVQSLKNLARANKVRRFKKKAKEGLHSKRAVKKSVGIIESKNVKKSELGATDGR